MYQRYCLNCLCIKAEVDNNYLRLVSIIAVTLSRLRDLFELTEEDAIRKI